MSSNMEGLSLGGCIQRFITFAWRVFYSIRKACQIASTGACLLAVLGTATLALPSSSSSELEDFLREEQAMRRSVISLPEIAVKVVLENKRTVYFPGRECAVLFALSFPMDCLGCSARPSVFSPLRKLQNAFPPLP